MSRAKKTGEIIAEKLSIKAETVKGIHERQKDPALEGIKHKDEVFEKFLGRIQKARSQNGLEIRSKWGVTKRVS